MCRAASAEGRVQGGCPALASAFYSGDLATTLRMPSRRRSGRVGPSHEGNRKGYLFGGAFPVSKQVHARIMIDHEYTEFPKNTVSLDTAAAGALQSAQLSEGGFPDGTGLNDACRYCSGTDGASNDRRFRETAKVLAFHSRCGHACEGRQRDAVLEARPRSTGAPRAVATAPRLAGERAAQSCRLAAAGLAEADWLCRAAAGFGPGRGRTA
jgi:hypothetical protein